jgi:hypothetical protein
MDGITLKKDRQNIDTNANSRLKRLKRNLPFLYQSSVLPEEERTGNQRPNFPARASRVNLLKANIPDIYHKNQSL